MNISISLTAELIGLIKAKVQSGRYTSASEVVREALRLLERADRQEAERVKALRRAWKEGIDSGDAGEVDFAGLRKAAASPPDWLERAWRGAKRRGLDKLTSQDIEAEIAAYRREKKNAPFDV